MLSLRPCEPESHPAALEAAWTPAFAGVTGLLGGSPAVLLFVLVFAEAAIAYEVSPRCTDEARRLVMEAVRHHRLGDHEAEDPAASYRRGVELGEEAVEADPGCPDAPFSVFINRGRLAQTKGKASQLFVLGELRSLLDRTIELEPKHAHAWEALGEMLLRMPRWLGGSEREGVAALEKSMRYAPEWAKPRLVLARHLAEEGERDRAAELARAALERARRAGQDDYVAEASALLTDLK